MLESFPTLALFKINRQGLKEKTAVSDPVSCLHYSSLIYFWLVIFIYILTTISMFNYSITILTFCLLRSMLILLLVA